MKFSEHSPSWAIFPMLKFVFCVCYIKWHFFLALAVWTLGVERSSSYKHKTKKDSVLQALEENLM